MTRSTSGTSGNALQLGESVDNQVSTRFSVEQPLFTGLALLSGLRAAEHGRTLAHERVRAERVDVRVRAQEAWFGLVKARQLVSVAEQAQAALEEHVRQLNALLAAGRATDLEVSRAEGRAATARVSLVRAEGAVDNAHLVLTTLLDLPSDTVLELTGADDDEVLEALGSTDDLVSQALTARPEIAIARETAGLATTRVDLESAPLWPQLLLRFGYAYENPNQRYFPAHDRFDASWEASVVLSWTVWDWTATAHAVKAARAEATASARRLDDVRDAVQLDVERERVSYATSLAQVAAARQAVTSAERAHAAAQRLFEAGRTPSLDVLDATTELSRARAELVQSLADARLSLVYVQRAVGREQ